jgi:hypothetical protein
MRRVISPEWERDREAVGGRPFGEFDPNIHDPDDPNSWVKQLKPIGNYGWGGAASLGEGLYNMAVQANAQRARDEQRASDAAGSRQMQAFMAGGGAADPAAIAGIMAHPATRKFGAAIYTEHLRQKQAEATMDRQQSHQLSLESTRDARAKELAEARFQAEQPMRDAQIRQYDAHAKLYDAQAAAVAASERQRLEASAAAAAATKADDEWYNNLYQDEDGVLRRRPASTPNAGPSRPAGPPGARPAQTVPSGRVPTGSAPGGAGLHRVATEDDADVGAPPPPPALRPEATDRERMQHYKLEKKWREDMNKWRAEAEAHRRFAEDREARGLPPIPFVDNQQYTDEEVQNYFDRKFPGVRRKGGGDVWTRDGKLQSVVETEGDKNRRSAYLQGMAAINTARENLGDASGFDMFRAQEFSFGPLGKRRPMEWGENLTKVGIGYRAAESAMAQVLKLMSGLTVTDREREDYKERYSPRATDNSTLLRWKLDSMAGVLAAYHKSRRVGATDEDVVAMIRHDNMLANKQKRGPAQPAKPQSGYRIERVPDNL